MQRSKPHEKKEIVFNTEDRYVTSNKKQNIACCEKRGQKGGHLVHIMCISPLAIGTCVGPDFGRRPTQVLDLAIHGEVGDRHLCWT